MVLELGEGRGMKLGEERGVKLGEERGESRMGQLAEKLIAAGRIPDVSKVARDGAFRQKMYKEFGIEKIV